MRTEFLTKASSAIEVGTGIALFAVPNLVARVLLDAGLAPSGIAVARLAGCGLFALGLACWTGGELATAQTVRALFVYNLLAGLYLGYLRVGGGFPANLLWPASALHIVLAFLLAGPAYQTVSAHSATRKS